MKIEVKKSWMSATAAGQGGGGHQVAHGADEGQGGRQNDLVAGVQQGQQEGDAQHGGGAVGGHEN